MSPRTVWHTVSLADMAATPWRNGGGVTRELVAWPPQGEWQWRMSVAEVEASGPFSRFEDVQRWFAVLRGAGVALDMGGERHTVTAGSAPLAFDGAAPTQCTLLDGATQDFNLMVRGGGSRAAGTSMLRINLPTRISINAPKIIAIWAINTWATARFDSEFIKIPPRSLVWGHVTRTAEMTLETDGALWMEMSQ